MQKSAYDTIILGAGINGCGIARELAGQGRRVLVLDKATIGGGTSSKSSRLIHGGLRYLEKLELGLVHEALLDRKELVETYPDLVQFRSFYIPVYKSSPRPAWVIWLGLKLYDLLSDKYSDHKSARIPRRQFAALAPAFRSTGLRAVFHFFDAKTNDLDLTRRIAQEARARGCTFQENSLPREIQNEGSHWVVKTETGTSRAPVLVNATGPWIDEVNQHFQLPADYHIRKVSGIHIVISGLLTRDLMFMQTREKRIFFSIPEPEYEHTIIGTTEREEILPCDQVRVNEDDISYLINNANSYLRVEHQIQRSAVQETWIGIRPLIAHKENPTKLSREYQLDRQRMEGTTLLHVFGGKLTTFLSLARKAVELLD